MIIYIVTNKINGLSYIGQTIQSLKNRKKRHLNGKKTYFSRAIKKYGEENFKWKILEKCKSKEELDEMEFHYIKQYNTLRPNGYNLTLGGEGTWGRECTEGTRNKMRAPKSEEHKRKLSIARIGMKHSSETIEKLKTVNSGKSNGMYGKKHSEEAKKKIREKAKLRIGDKNPNYGNRGEKSKLFNKTRNNYIWKLISLNGEFLEINRIEKFCRDYFEETGIKLIQSNFYHLRANRIKQYKGFKINVEI